MAPLLPETWLLHETFPREDPGYRATFCFSRCPFTTLESARHRFLAPAEIAAWERLRFPARRESHLLGRYCAKEAVAAHGSLPSLLAFEIQPGVFQQPVVRGPGPGALQVSLSHSAGWAAAVAFDEAHPMGIDIECVRPDHRAAIRSQLTAREVALVSAAPHPEDPALAVLWTLKEALSKTLRTGLMTPFQVFELAPASTWSGPMLIAEFTSFAQYRAIGLPFGPFALGLVLPLRSVPHGGLPALAARFRALLPHPDPDNRMPR